MTEHDTLLANILTHPDDDLARLVFADFLEEKLGERDRADFIRTQVTKSELSYRLQWWIDKHHWTGREFRWLYGRHETHGYYSWNSGPNWPGGEWVTTRLGGVNLRWTGGFVSEADLLVDDFLARAADVLAGHPVTVFRLTVSWPRDQEVARVSVFPSITDRTDWGTEFAVFEGGRDYRPLRWWPDREAMRAGLAGWVRQEIDRIGFPFVRLTDAGPAGEAGR